MSRLDCFLFAIVVVFVESTEIGLTPFGPWPLDCIHEVPSGSQIINEKDHFIVKSPLGEIRKIARCKWPINLPEKVQSNSLVDGDGWQQYVKMESGNETTGLFGYWTVPVDPVENGQILYTFTGLQNIDWVPPQREPTQAFDIIQPVLQYGRTPAGGGNYWGIASWYVTLGVDVVHSTLKETKSGATIYGVMNKTKSDTWFINAIDQDTNVDSGITITRSLLSSQPWSYVTLEVYDVYSCEQYPKSGTPIPYTQLKLELNYQEWPLTWEVGTDGQTPPICDSSINIIDEQDVSIIF